MQVLVRYITRKSRTGVSHTDREIQGDKLTIGRGSDADLFLSDLHVALHHAVLRRASENQYTIQARTPSGIKINGRTVQTGSVRAGDTVTIGLSTLELRRGEADHELVIDVEETQAPRGGAVDVGATTLRETGLSIRRWAWIAFVAILLLGMVVPLGHMYSEDRPTTVLSDNRESNGDSDEPRGLGGRLIAAIPWHLAGGDQIWESGSMSRPHRFFGRECSVCHQEPFERVTSSACLECHEDQVHHTDDTELMRTSGLSDRRCAECHREHSGIEDMVGTDPRLCTDCHAEPGESMPGADVQPASAFLDGSHPQFRIRLVSISDTGEVSWRRLRMTETLNEDNGLVFPHDVHVSPDGVRGPDGREQLACTDCHRPGSEGVTMQPVRFERDCQGCHQLDFDPADPDRELPHGEAEVVLSTLEEYYARTALEGGYTHDEADPPKVVRRQRPGDERLEEHERQTALEWSREWAHTVAGELFEYRTCKTCHEVDRSPDSETGWQVAPVAMTQEWFPAHRFDHDPHQKIACVECHDATASTSSEDVLMPDIQTCLQCHGDSDSTARVASRCVDCHDFHAAGELPMKDHAESMQEAEWD